MTIKKSDVSDDEKPVTIHAQNGAYVNVVIEKHYHAPGWLTPELVAEFLKALQGGKRGDNPIIKLIEEEKAEEAARIERERVAVEKEADIERAKAIHTRVVITGVDIHFVFLVGLIVKIMLATILASIIITVAVIILLAPFAMIFGHWIGG